MSGETEQERPLLQAVLAGLKAGGEQRDQGEVAAATAALRRLARRVSEGLVAAASRAEEPGNAAPLASELLTALLRFRAEDWAACRQVLHALLFDAPHELCLQEQYEPLAAYLLPKYLLCIERGPALATECDQLFFLLKRLQLARAEPLQAVLQVFLLRWLLRRRQFARLGPLLRLMELPRRAGAAAQAKFMFYRGLFASLGGQFALARDCAEKALRRPPRQTDTRGYRCFRLLATKHLAVMELMLSRPVPPALLQGPGLGLYRHLVALVTRGENRQFEALIAARAADFERDLVGHAVRRMRGVVLQNALAKLAAAYTSIGAAEALQRLGVAAEGFDLLAFAAKSRGVVERFSYDAARETLRFEPARESFDDPALQADVQARLLRLERLNEQIQRGLRFAPREGEAERAEPEREGEEAELDALEFDDFDFDD